MRNNNLTTDQIERMNNWSDDKKNQFKKETVEIKNSIYFRFVFEAIDKGYELKINKALWRMAIRQQLTINQALEIQQWNDEKKDEFFGIVRENLKPNQAYKYCSYSEDMKEKFKSIINKCQNIEFIDRVLETGVIPSNEFIKLFPESFNKSLIHWIITGKITENKAIILSRVPINEQEVLVDEATTEWVIDFQNTVDNYLKLSNEAKEALKTLHKYHDIIGYDLESDESNERNNYFNQLKNYILYKK